MNSSMFRSQYYGLKSSLVNVISAYIEVAQQEPNFEMFTACVGDDRYIKIFSSGAIMEEGSYPIELDDLRVDELIKLLEEIERKKLT